MSSRPIYTYFESKLENWISETQKVDCNKGIQKIYDISDFKTLTKLYLNVIKSQLWRLGAKTLTRTRDIDEYVNPSLFL